MTNPILNLRGLLHNKQDKLQGATCILTHTQQLGMQGNDSERVLPQSLTLQLVDEATK
jgi:hypothetical protein